MLYTIRKLPRMTSIRCSSRKRSSSISKVSILKLKFHKFIPGIDPELEALEALIKEKDTEIKRLEGMV